MLCLVKLREAAGLTQMAVAAAINTDRSTIAKWETGAAKPRADKLPLLAKLYGCSIDDLFGEDSNAGGQAGRT